VGKYDPLGDYLSNRTEHKVALSFSELERILGFELPPSANTIVLGGRTRRREATHMRARGSTAVGGSPRLTSA
jgi:hypothetical protein